MQALQHHDPIWVYERWNHVVTSEQFPNLIQDIADVTRDAREFAAEQENQLRKAEKAIKRAAEDRRQAQLAAAQKKKNNKQKK